MTVYPCPKGHASAADDFCDTCGARIGGTMVLPAPGPAGGSSSPPSPSPSSLSPSSPSSSSPSSSSPSSSSPSAAGSAAAEKCPHCGTPRTAMWRFCEDCGFDHTTGRAPVPETPPAARITGQWTATIFADREYFHLNAIEGVQFPADAQDAVIVLPAPQARIGRQSRSQGTSPEIDLSADPGVSHSHALLTLSVDGVWLVSDLGSTNGTYVNDDARPLSAGQSRALRDGDCVHVGAWTTIALRAPA